MTSDWKYFGQTPLEVMRQQYNTDNFDPETRLYAIHKEKLVGFHTAAVSQPGFAEMEFPIVDPTYPDLVDRLMQQQFTVLRDKQVTKVQSRRQNFGV